VFLAYDLSVLIVSKGNLDGLPSFDVVYSSYKVVVLESVYSAVVAYFFAVC